MDFTKRTIHFFNVYYAISLDLKVLTWLHVQKSAYINYVWLPVHLVLKFFDKQLSFTSHILKYYHEKLVKKNLHSASDFSLRATIMYSL